MAKGLASGYAAVSATVVNEVLYLARALSLSPLIPPHPPFPFLSLLLPALSSLPSSVTPSLPHLFPALARRDNPYLPVPRDSEPAVPLKIVD